MHVSSVTRACSVHVGEGCEGDEAHSGRRWTRGSAHVRAGHAMLGVHIYACLGSVEGEAPLEHSQMAEGWLSEQGRSTARAFTDGRGVVE